MSFNICTINNDLLLWPNLLFAFKSGTPSNHATRLGLPLSHNHYLRFFGLGIRTFDGRTVSVYSQFYFRWLVDG